MTTSNERPGGAEVESLCREAMDWHLHADKFYEHERDLVERLVAALRSAHLAPQAEPVCTNGPCGAEDCEFPECCATPQTAEQGEPLFVIFDGPPSHESGRFVEVETAGGGSVGCNDFGWREYAGTDGLWKLGPFYTRPQPSPPQAEEK